jgi:hypothetical protein
MTEQKFIPDYLAKLNAHPRDEFITFEEGPHIYTVHGDSSFTSVTTWNHSHFGVFDSDPIIDNILKSKKMKDPNYAYYGMTKEQIKTLWSTSGKDASSAGTDLHYNIECYYNYMEVENDSKEFGYFLKFDEDFGNLKPYRTEWMVYHEELKLSGSIDMVFENPDGTLQIYDWKRCKEIEHESRNGNSSITPCISHLPDSKYWHYVLQLNMYKRILESKYGKKVTDLYLVRLHPDSPGYDRIHVQPLDKEMEDLVELRRQQVLNGTDRIIKH